MTTKATDSVLNLVSPPISNMVLSQGTLNNVTIGVTVPNVGWFTQNHATRQFINGVELIMLNADTTFYVSTTGTDIAANGLSSLTPWRTRQYAWNYIQDHYHLAGHAVTIQLADGVYSDSCFIGGNVAGQTGSGAITFQGNVGNPAACHLQTTTGGTGGAGFSANNAAFTVQGFKFSATAGSTITSGTGVYGGENATIFLNNCNFANCDLAHMYSTFGTGIYAQNYAVSGSSLNHIVATEAATFYSNPTDTVSTITFIGLPTFSGGVVLATTCSYVRLLNTEVQFVGSALGVRYSVTSNAVINVFFGGANFIPGDSPGVSSSGGQYI